MSDKMRCNIIRVCFRVFCHLLACCVLLVCAQESTELGKDVTLTFNHQMTSEDNEYICYVFSPGATQPFYSDGNIDPNVLQDGQADRFQVQIQQLGRMITIFVTITSVEGIDTGLYKVSVLERKGGLTDLPVEYSKILDVIFPPPTASCTVNTTEYSDRWRLAICTTSASNVYHAICCFQQSRLIPPYKGAIECDINHACSGVFWVKPEHSISCCAVESCAQINQTSCTDSIHQALVTTIQPLITSSSSGRSTGSQATTNIDGNICITAVENAATARKTTNILIALIVIICLAVICYAMFKWRTKIFQWLSCMNSRGGDRPSTMQYNAPCTIGDNRVDGDTAENVAELSCQT